MFRYAAYVGFVMISGSVMHSEKKRTTCIVLFFHIIFALIVVSEPLAGENPKKTVLYINSYHNGYQWSDMILKGIRSKLEESSYKIDLQIEYMDAKKYNVAPVIEELRKLYLKKFGNIHFDVVMVSDDDAFNFALKYRPQIFPGVPIVFCGVNDLEKEEEEIGNITGVVENFDLAGTLEIALKLHPEKRRMIVVGDNSTAGLGIRHQIEALAPRFKEKVQIDYWIQLDLAEVQSRVKELSQTDFLFFIPYYQVIGDRFFTAEEVMSAISDSSNVPLYTSWEFLLGSGAVGGSLLSGYDHGREAAKKALQILCGAAPGSIPIETNPKGLYLFDYNILKRFHIDESLLPAGSKLINEPSPFYKLPRELFWTIMVSIFLLLVALVFLIINMLARRKVERKIKNQLTFQETLIDTIPQLVSWKDMKGSYLGANRTFASFFGLNNVAEVVGQSTRNVVKDDKYVDWSVSADAAVASGKEAYRKKRKRIVAKNGEISWLEVNKVPLKNQSGNITGVLTTAENITREYNLEKQLLQSQKMEAIGTMAGGIAHDFNNILTSIINSTELAIGDVDEDSQTAKDLERVLKAARRGGSVVKQILTFSRPSQEGFQSTDLSKVISEVVSLMEVSLPGNISIKSYIKPGLQSIYADPTQIHQAVMNLSTNAFHALRKGGGEIEIRLEESALDEEQARYLDLQPGKYMRLSVTDDGPGISSKIIDKIFDPFFSSKSKKEGTGLGLTVALAIIKGHNGALRVSSEAGVGSEFEMYIPVLICLDKETSTEKKGKTKADGGRILFVEDDPDQLQTAPRLLRDLGYEVDAVGESSKALELLAARPSRFDLIISDYDMPGLNGVELAKGVQRQQPDLPVIIVSGREEALGAVTQVENVVRVVIKPYEKNLLKSVIEAALSRKGRNGTNINN